MTRKQVDQYLALKREVSFLEDEIVRLRSRSGEMVTDVVSGSSSFYPYIQRTFVISGQSVKDLELLSRKAQRLQERKERVLKEAEAIDSFIDQVNDSQMRQILYMKYLQGMSWLQVARKFGGKNTEDGVRMKVARFFGE